MKHKKSGKKGFVEGHDQGIGKGNFANLPQEVIQKQYPNNKVLRSGMIDDTITGIDDVISRGEVNASRHISNQK